MRLVELIKFGKTNFERCLLTMYHAFKFDGLIELKSGEIKSRIIQTRIPRASKINVSDALNKGADLVDFHNKKDKGRLWFLTTTGIESAEKLLEARSGIEWAVEKELSGSVKKVDILFMGIGPTDESRLRLDQEAREIENRIRSSDFRDCFNFKSKWAVRVDDFFQYLNEIKPHIVHFSGHGSSCGGMAFEDASGNAKIVSPRALAEALSTMKDNIQVVVFNACHSHLVAKEISNNIDCSIGMLDSINDESAIQFSAAFYRSLGFGKSVSRAFREARSSLIMEGLPGDHLLELYSRNDVDSDRVFVIQ